ncbi:MAG: ZIP family metal transporter [Gemmatimonadota bacterium]|nr:ZIP family metal transporter [Gemmatimonadota bacterium]MDH3476763.1 ZIP family metal transporter [Gemmatimonadota bacterium]MDH3568647.1 ZIP family metal transporter [Gemmatimonadota bacterium]
MWDWFASLSSLEQAALGGLGTWFLTLLGTLPVLFVRQVNRRVMDAMMGGAGGIMVAAACWSLLVPALAVGGVLRVVPGLMLGAAVMYLMDRIVPHLHPEFPNEARREGPSVAWRRSALLMAAITIHNLPEGLAVGLGFGQGDLRSALVLALGIGLQNIPEGLAIALPLRRDGVSRGRALWYGQLSAAVEPVAAVAGAVFVTLGTVTLPIGLAFAAGAMLYVVVEELLPETTRSGHVDVATIGFIAGFTLMMSLDQLAP